MVSRAYELEGFVRIMESWGLRDVLLPFLLIFVIVFAILSKIRLFGEEKKRFNAAIAFVMSVVTVVFHVTGMYPSGLDPVTVINEAIPNIAVVIVAAIAVIFIIGLFGAEIKNYPLYATGGVIITCGVIFVLFVIPDLTPLTFTLALILLAGMVFTGGESNYMKGGITVGAFIVILLAFGYPLGWFDSLPAWFTDEAYYGWIAMIFIAFAVVGLVVGGEKEKK